MVAEEPIARYQPGQTFDFSNIVADDGDGDDVSVTLTLSDIDAGILSSTAIDGATVSFENGTFEAIGTTADVNAVLAALQFSPSPGYSKNTTLITTITDGKVGEPVSGSTITLRPIYTPDTPYLSLDDSPFRHLGFSSFYLEDFEDGAPNERGLSISDGVLQEAGKSLTDSVDGDDGATDGSGNDGRSWHANGANELMLSFDADALGGQLPTHVGFALTDIVAAAEVSVRAYDVSGELIGDIEPTRFGDGSNNGETDEDRFFGLNYEGGISQFAISVPRTGWEIDHIQYGVASDNPPESGFTWTDTYFGEGSDVSMARDAFEASLQANSIVVEDFENLSDSNIGESLTTAVGTLAATIIKHSVTDSNTGKRSAFSGTQYLLQDARRVDGSVGGGYTEVVFDTPQSAFGFSASDFGDEGGELFLTLGRKDGTTEALRVPHAVPAPNGSRAFFGAVATESPFVTATIDSTHRSDGVAIDDLIIGKVLPEALDEPVPANGEIHQFYEQGETSDLADITVTDPDGEAFVRLILEDAAAGTLTTGNAGAVTSNFDSVTGTWSARGAVDDVNALLKDVGFEPASDWERDVRIDVAVEINPLLTHEGKISLSLL